MTGPPQASPRYVDEESAKTIAVLDRANEDQLRRIARLMLEECGYLEQHNPPEGHHQYGRYPCTSDTWHLCSGGGDHDQRCKAVGGKGLKRHGLDVSCPAACEQGPPESWCNCAGFDCGTCETVMELRAIVAEIAA